MKSRTLIYGSSGFLAKAFRDELKRRNAPFIEVGRNNLNMNDATCVRHFIQEEDFDSIFFSVGPVPCKTHSMYFENLNLLQNLLEALFHSQKSPKFTYVSSDAVYGSVNENLRTEKTDVSPDSLHGKMHLVREIMLQSFNFPVLILRCSAIFGLGDRHRSYGPNRFYHELSTNRELLLFGRGGDKRDHVWIKDFGRVAADLHLGSLGVFNLVSGVSTSFYDIATEMLRLSGEKFSIKFEGVRTTYSNISYDNTKLIDKLGYSISNSLALGLRNYFQSGGEISESFESKG